MSYQVITVELLQKILQLTDLDVTIRTLIEEVDDKLGKVSKYHLHVFDPSLEELSDFLTRLCPTGRKVYAQRDFSMCPEDIVVCLPLLSTKKNILGVIGIEFSQKLELSDSKKRYLETITCLIAMAIERSQSAKETKRILRELQSSQERLDLALQAQKMGVWDWDILNNKLFWDDTMFDIFGVEKKDFSESFEFWENCLLPEDSEPIMETIRSVLDNNLDFDHQFRINRHGEVRTISAVGSVIRDEFGKAIRFTGLNWDVTEKVLATEKLEQERAKAIANAKMASLGEMASGIAHEINNPLTIILNRTSQLKTSILEKEIDKKQVIGEIEKVESTFQRIVKIIRGLKAFSRNSDNDPMISCDINSIIVNTLELCLEKFKTHGIQISMIGLDHLYFLSCRPSQISQVLLNLLNNSFDAINGSSNPWIKIQVSLQSEARDAFIKIQVIDSGRGIPRGIAEKMMAPFFTTKDVGQGTGLGLPISKGIIEEHKGRLWLENESENTSFAIRLPLEEVAPKVAGSVYPA
jgi:signal transduction histidine kinase